MRFLIVNLLIISLLTISSFANAQKKEIDIEIERLIKLKEEVEKKIRENKEVLNNIKKEQERLKKAKLDLENLEKEIKKDRFKKLAKDFEGMEPEMAGEKLSKLADPKKAAYILYNMKSKKAGEALNFIEAKRVSEIVKILTELKNKNE